MVKTSVLATILTLCAMILMHGPAQAWVADEYYNAVTELPLSVKESLPARPGFMWGTRGEDTIYE